MTELAILIPVLGRAQLIAPLVENIDEATATPHRTILICSPEHTEAETREACLKTSAETVVVPFKTGRGNFAKKINHAYRLCSEPWIFQGATDLVFHHGWDVNALRLAAAAQVGVIGTNDLGNPAVIRGRAATHILFSRDYVETHGGTVDGSGEVFSEHYSHQFVDTEFVEIARMRGQFRSCRRAVVEHLHPHWKKAANDAVYEKGMRDFNEDSALFTERMRIVRETLQPPPRRPPPPRRARA